MSLSFTAPASRLTGTDGQSDFQAGISRTGRVKTHFHFWSGVSGRTYLHTVYAPDKLPLLVRSVVIVVASRPHERKVLFLGQAGDEETALTRSAGFRQALRDGGNEIHVHFLAGSAEERDQGMRDLAIMLGKDDTEPWELAA